MTENLPATKAPTPVDRLKMAIAAPTVQEQFRNAMADNAPLFVASLIDLYASDRYLQECQPSAVIMEALKAATLKLPINKSLGFAYVIAYKKVPQFQIGYKGLLQLAMRTAQYRFINADSVYEGELMSQNKLTGEIILNGTRTSDKIIGYFAYMETLNGFQKVVYWTKAEIEAHAKRFSMSYNSSHSPWKTDFDAMAIKTVLKALLGKYGIMSVEMAQAFDRDAEDTPEDTVKREIEGAANQDFIDIRKDPELADHICTGEPPSLNTAVMSDAEKAEIEAMEAGRVEQGPGY